MMNHFYTRILLLLLSLSTAFLVPAQTDTSLVLREVQVERAGQLRSTIPGEMVIHFDSAQLAQAAFQNTADFLSRQGGIYLKTYGQGSLATSSLRGGSASQTAIIWNGLAIQSPMLGLSDIALMPAFFTDEMELQYGSGGATWGSGAIGGALLFRNKIPAQKEWNAAAGIMAGSFGAQAAQAKLQLRKGKIASVSRYIYSTAKNDFYYPINEDIPPRQQSNAALKQAGFLQDIYWNPEGKSQLEAHIWWQQNNRQIPPTSTQSFSLAQQADEAFRSSIQWKYILARHVLTTKAGYIVENIDYQDDYFKTRALSGFKTSIGEVQDAWSFCRNWSLLSGINFTHYMAVADGYKNGVSEQRTALFAALRRTRGPVDIQLNLRQEWSGENPVPLMPGVGFLYRPFQHFSFRIKSARHYRLPTLNDRFWQPGGNPNLKAEQGWSHEAGADIHWLGWTYRATVYTRRIQDWILWSLTDGASYWAPNNITEVHSRGAEQRLEFRCQLDQWRISISGIWNYTKSTNEKALTYPKMAAGEQLIYVPLHQASGNLCIGWRKLELSGGYQYTSKVNGVNDDLPSWKTGYSRLQFTPRFQDCNAQFFLEVNNIFNARYRIVERRPMPGRNYQTGLIFCLAPN